MSGGGLPIEVPLMVLVLFKLAPIQALVMFVPGETTSTTMVVSYLALQRVFMGEGVLRVPKFE